MLLVAGLWVVWWGKYRGATSHMKLNTHLEIECLDQCIPLLSWTMAPYFKHVPYIALPKMQFLSILWKLLFVVSLY